MEPSIASERGQRKGLEARNAADLQLAGTAPLNHPPWGGSALAPVRFSTDISTFLGSLAREDF